MILSGLNFSALIDVDLIQTFFMQDFMGKLIVVIIMIFSVISWAIIGFKWIQIRAAYKQTKVFIRNCREKYGSLEDAYQLSLRYPGSPLSRMIKELYLEFELQKWTLIEDETRKFTNKTSDLNIYIENIEKAMDKSTIDAISNLERYLNMLNITQNICPLLGLLGTVWGLLAAFQVVAIQGSADFNVISAGISTALLTTVAGLVAAIPAVLFYNHFVSKNNEIISDMDTFANELSTVIRKKLGGN